jgi:predicted nucleic-acid-binding Zn-ribbon protein
LREDGSIEWVCIKCGSKGFRRRQLRLRGDMGATGFLDAEEVTAYICDECGYMEFYSYRKK